MQVFPKIDQRQDAERLIRRAWGGWLFLVAAGGVLFVMILGSLDGTIILQPFQWGLLIVAVAALIALNYALRTKNQPWAALVLAGLALVAIVRVIYMFFDNGFAEHSPLAAAFFPIMLLFALLSLVNAYRGASALKGDLPVGPSTDSEG